MVNKIQVFRDEKVKEYDIPSYYNPINDPQQLDRLHILAQLLSPNEMAKLFWSSGAANYAKVLGINSDGAEREICQRIYDYWQNPPDSVGTCCESEDDGKEHDVPPNNNGPIKYSERGARLFTWSINKSNIPRSITHQEMVVMLNLAFKKYSNTFYVDFKHTPDEVGEIYIDYRYIPGSVFAQAKYPTSGNPCRTCSDIFFNSRYNWSNLRFFYEIAIHEIGHTVGLPHSKTAGGKNIMESAHTGRVEFGPQDIEDMNRLYPNG